MATIDIEFNPHIKPLDRAELETCKAQLEELDTTLELSEINNKQFLPESAPESMRSFVDNMKSMIYQQRNALISSMKEMGLGEQISTDMISGLKQGLAFLTANVETLFTSSGQIGKVFASIPKTMTKEFNTEFTDMSRAASSIINRAYKSMGPQTDAAFESILTSNEPFKKAANSIGIKFGLSGNQMSNLIQSVVQLVTPSFARENYYQTAIDHSKGTLKRFSVLPEYSTYKERMPEKYRNFPEVPVSVPYATGSRRKAYQGNVTQEEYDAIRKAAGKYPAFERALTMAGVAYRGTINGKAGQLIMPDTPIKEAEFAAALGFLDRDILRPALEGAPMHKHSLLNSNDYEQMAMARKTSRTPTEVFGALRDLQEISTSQPLYLDKPRSYSRPLGKSSGVDSAVSVRPDYYQIMSLTLDDFKNGVILDDKAGREFAYNNKAAGKSINRMISSSIYTDLLGMSGHNTFGSASGPRKMIQLDLTDRLFEKKPNGELVWENGKVKANKETMDFVASLFDEKNGKTITTPGGHTFSYPTINHGNNGTYVPTGIHKNGIIDLAEESAYLEVASKFIDKYGVDVFKNLVNEDEEFTTVKGLNKPIDARNRMHTPAVPFSKLGGSMPSKEETAFVDFNSITGFDGGMIVMPGYLPAKAMTVRSVGFKGSAAQVDFHKMIKDVYGEDVEKQGFFVPTWNAPQEMKDLYNKKGIEAVREAYNNKESIKKYGLKSFDEDFVDLFKYKAAIDVSMNKTPFYKGMSHSQTQEAFFDILSMIGGMYGVETDKEFLSKTDSISRQVSQNLNLSEADIKRNNKKWNSYINTLRNDPQKTIDMLFSNPDDPLSQRVQENKSLLFSDPEARKRVDDAILDAMNSKENQRLFSKGDALNALAVNNPFELISAIASKNKIKPQNTNLAKVLSLKGKGDADAVALAAWADTLEMGGWRYPNNVGEQFELLNSKEYIDMLDAYQMSRDAMIVNMATIKKMGGGDIDGDTIQAVRNRLAEVIKRTYETTGKITKDLKTTVQTPDDIPLMEGGKSRKVQPSDYADILYRKAASVFEMAAVSNAGDALAQGNWLDPDWAKFARQAGVDLRAMYDIDTTFAKTGVLANWSHIANKAKNMGTPYVRMFKDLQGAVEEGDFSKVKDFSQVNFPSRFSNLTVSSLAAGINNPYSNNVVESFIKVQEQLQGLKELESSGNPVDAAQAAFLRKNNGVMAQIASHRAQIVSTKDENEMLGLLSNWENLVNTELQKTKVNDPTNQERIDYWLDRLGDVRFQRGRMQHLRDFGITETARDRREGFIPYSGLSGGRLTGDISEFNQVFDSEQDAIKARISMITGADEALLASQRAAAEKQAAAERVYEANNRTYSYTQLHSIEKEAAGPLNWYNKYVKPIPDKEPTTPLQLLGTAIHKTQEYWANRRIANNEDYGTPEEMTQFLNNFLLNWEDPDTHQKLFPTLPTEDNEFYDQKVKTRYKEVLDAAKQYPNLFRDKKIIGVESKVSPNFGVDQNGNRLNSVGYIDLVTQDLDKAGAITNWDTKASFEHDKSLTGIHKFDQPVVYAGANKAQKVGIISYKGGNLETQSVDVTPEMISDVEGRMSRLTGAIIPLMGKEDILGEILDGYFDNYLLPNAVKGTRQAPASGAPVSGAYIENAAKAAGAPIVIQGKNVSVESMPVHQTDQSELTTAFSNRQYVDEQIEKYETLQNQMRAKEARYDKGYQARTQWDNLDYMYSEAGYMDVATRMRNRGASPDEMALFKTAFNLGQEQYNSLLRAGASGDLANFSESLAEKIYTRNTTSEARNIIREQKAIDEEYEKSLSAYTILNSKPNKTKEDEKALENAQKQLEATEEMKAEYERILSEDAVSSMTSNVLKYTLKTQGSKKSESDMIAYNAAMFDKERKTLLSSLDNLYQNEKLDKDTYTDLKSKIEQTTTEDYTKTLQEQAEKEKMLSSRQRQSQLEQLEQRNMLSEAQQTHAYERQNRNLYGQSHSRLVNNYRNQQEMLWNAEQAYISNINSAASIQKDLNTWRSIFKNDKNAEGLTASDYLKKYKDGGGNKETYAMAAQIKSAEENLRHYNTTAEEAAQEMSKFSKPAMAMRAGFTAIKDSVSALAQRFGRQLFNNVLRETTNFVKQFDASMNQIQMITLKSDEQISQLGDSLIDKAKELKVSVSEITQSAATLYRQGLSDQEVDERLEVISKFSKVSGTKVDAATKLVTVAMNTGLVTQAQQAADIVTALGDNAATKAAEIEKGIEKAGAAAAADGTTFAQLSAMLTAITSTTQIGGNVAGRTLNTIFGRMNKIGTNELIYDENGNAVSGSAVAKLLEEEGIRMYDEYGNKRSTFDTLYALSQKWEGLSDAKQQQFANAIAGTRQYSNFAAIMTGMAEGKVGEYLALAGESEGITDKKYEVYTKSLEASITDLRNTWDGLVNDMTDSGALTGGLGFLTNFVQGIDKANESLGGLGVTLAGVLPSLMIMGGLKSGTLVGAGVAAAGGIIAAIVSAIGNQKSAEEEYSEYIESINKYSDYKTSQINRAKQLKEKDNDRTDEENAEYERLLNNLSISINYAESEQERKNTELTQREQAEQIIEQAEKQNKANRVKRLAANIYGLGESATEQITDELKDYDKNITAEDSYQLQKINERYLSNPEDINHVLSGIDTATGITQDQIRQQMKSAYMDNNDFAQLINQSLSEGQTYSDYIDDLITRIEASSKTIGDEEKQQVSEFFKWYNNQGYAGTREDVEKEKVRSLYLQYLAQYDESLSGEELAAIADQATNDYFANKKALGSLDAFTAPFVEIFDLKNDRRTTESISAAEQKYLQKSGYEPKSSKFEALSVDYVQNGYYRDNKTGKYLTTEQAEEQIDQYNKQIEQYNNQPTTQETQLYRAYFNGKEFANAKSKSTIDKFYRSVIDQYLNLQNSVFKELISADKQNSIKGLKGNIKQLLTSGVKKEELYENLVKHLSSLGIEVSEEYENQLVDYFAADNYSVEMMFKNGVLTDINALNIIQRKLEDYGIRFTGTLADFMNSTASEMFSQAEDTITIKKRKDNNIQIETPNLTGIRNIFQGSAAETYKTWASKNQLAINATEALQMINGKNKLGKRLTTIQDMFDYVNEQGESLWQVFSQDEEMAPLLLSLERDMATGKISAASTLPSDIITRLQQLSTVYAEESLTSQEKANRVRDAVNNIKDNGYYVSYDSMLLAKNAAYSEYEQGYINRKNKHEQEAVEAVDNETPWTEQLLTEEEWAAKNWIDKYDISKTDRDLIIDTYGAKIGNKLLDGKDLSEIEQMYYDTASLNLRQGSSMSKRQQLNLALALRNRIGTTEVYDFIQNNRDIAKSFLNGFGDEEMQNDFLNGILKSSDEARTEAEKKAIEQMDIWYKQQSEHYNFKYKNDKNASKLLQNFDTLLEGSISERVATFTPYLTQAQELQNAQYTVLNKNASTSDRKAVSSLLGMRDEDVRNLMDSANGKNYLKELLKDKTSKILDEFAKSFNISLEGDIAQNLRDAVAQKSPELLDTVDALLESVEGVMKDAQGHIIATGIKGESSTQFGDLYADALDAVRDAPKDLRTTLWFGAHQNEITQLIGQNTYFDETAYNMAIATRQKEINEARARGNAGADFRKAEEEISREDYIIAHTARTAMNTIAKKYNLSEEDYNESWWTQERAGLQEAVNEGWITSEDYFRFLLGGTANAQRQTDVYNRLIEGMFGDAFDNKTGKFDTSKMSNITKFLEDLPNNEERFAIFSTAAGKYKDLWEALTVTLQGNTSQLPEILKKISDSISDDKVADLTAYTDGVDDLSKALQGIAKGGQDAVVGRAKFNSSIVDETNTLHEAKKAVSKDYSKLTKTESKALQSALGVSAGELEIMSVSQRTSGLNTAEEAARERIARSFKARIETLNEVYGKIDTSAFTQAENGTVDFSKATGGLSKEAQTAWSELGEDINNFIDKDILKIDTKALLRISGYDLDMSALDENVDAKTKKEIYETAHNLFAEISKLMEQDIDLSDLKLNADLTIDSKTLTAAAGNLVENWNKLAKKYPLTAKVALQMAGSESSGVTGANGSTQSMLEYTSSLEQWGKSISNVFAGEDGAGISNDTAYLLAAIGLGKSGGRKSSGGGGKSAAQKALEAAQKAVKEPTHRAKMAESAEKAADEFNDVSSYSLAINNQYEAYKDLAEVYKKNIADLEATRKGLSEDSDEYDKLTDAIYQYEEALDGLTTKIAELNKKQIAFIAKLQEYQDKLITFTDNVHEARGELALAREQYPEYRAELLDQMRVKGMTYRQNIEDRKQYEEELARVRAEEPEGSTNEQELLEKIREIDLEQYELEKQNFDLWSEYLKNETTQLQQALSDEARPYQNIEGLQSIYTQIFGNREDYAAQRNSIVSRRQAAIDLFDVYDRMIPELEKNLADKAQNPEARREAEEALQKAKEDRANAYLQVQSLGNDLLSSLLSEISTKFSDLLAPVQHQADISSIAGDIQRDTEAWNNYRGSLQSQAEAYATLAEGASAEADVLREALETINQAEQPELYRQTRDALYEQEKAQLQYVKTVIETTRQIQQSITEQTELAAQRSGIMPQSNVNVAETLGKMYLGNYDYNSYRQQLNTKEASTNKLLMDSEQMVHFYEGRIQEDEVRSDPKLLQENLENLAKWREKNASLQAQSDAQRKEKAQSYIDQVKQRTEDKLEDKQFAMGELQDLAARAQQNENFELYRSIMQQEMETAQQMIEVYTEAIRELEIRMAHMEEGTPEYNAAKKQLNEFKTSLRKAQITVAQAADEIQKSIIDELLKNFESLLRGPKHVFDIASIYGNMYQGAKQYQDYRDMLAVQNEQRDKLTVILEQEIAELQGQLSSTFGTPQYDRVVEAIYQKETEKENLYAQSVEARRAIDNSIASEVLENYQKEMGKYDRSITAYSLQANYYSANKDDQRYLDAVNKQKEAIKAKQEAEKQNLQMMQATAATLHTNTEGFEKLEQQIHASAQSIYEMDIELLNLEKAMQSMQIEELLERIGRVDTIDTHGLSMISTELSRYENLGQLTNVNTMIDVENEAQAKRAEHLETAITDMKNLLDTMTEGSDEYWQLASSIMKYEEALAQTNATIEKNNKLQDENRKKILEIRKSAEDAVVKEIEDRIKREREMLASTDNIQQKIVNIIRERYKDEAELIKKNLEQQKDALNQEKSLITERLNFRKKSMETENKQEELYQLQQQLALISGDSSRTKEAKELSKKITDLQRELTMSETESEVQAQADLLEDQIQAIDDDINFRQEKLNDFLEDANNFREEVDGLIQGSFENLTAWIQENDKAYQNTLEAGEENMLKSWEDTWKKMNGIVDTYWEQVEEIMSSWESYNSFMSESQERANASDTAGKGLFDIRIQELWDNYINSTIDNADYEHGDVFAVTKNSEALQELLSYFVEDVTGLEPEDLRKYTEPTTYAQNKPNGTDLPDVDKADETEFENAVNNWKTANEKVESVIERAIKEVAINDGAMSDEMYATVATSLQQYMNTSSDYADKIKSTAADAVDKFLKGEDKLKNLLGASGTQFFAEATENLNANRENILGLLSSLEQQSGLTLSELFGITTTGYENQKDLFHEMALETENNLKDTTDATGTALAGTALDAAEASKKFAEDFTLTEENMYKGLVDTTTGFENDIDETEHNIENAITGAAGEITKAAGSITTAAGAVTIAAGNMSIAGTNMKDAAGTIKQAGNDIQSYLGTLKEDLSKSIEEIKSSYQDTSDKVEALQDSMSYEGQIKSLFRTLLGRDPYEYDVNWLMENRIAKGYSIDDIKAEMMKWDEYLALQGKNSEKYAFNQDTGLIDVGAGIGTSGNVSGRSIDTKGTVTGTASGGTGTGGPSKKKVTVYYVTDSGSIREADGWDNVPGNALSASETRSEVESFIAKPKVKYYVKGLGGPYDTRDQAIYARNNWKQQAIKKYNDLYAKGDPAAWDWYGIAQQRANADIEAYKKGGIVDYTGLAWVDGTKTQPESFLDATDTKLLRGMLDAFNKVNYIPTTNYVDPTVYGNTTNVGDINITINAAEFKSDEDYDKVAKRVGQAFTKELQRSGLNLPGYTFG